MKKLQRFSKRYARDHGMVGEPSMRMPTPQERRIFRSFSAAFWQHEQCTPVAKLSMSSRSNLLAESGCVVLS